MKWLVLLLLLIVVWTSGYYYARDNYEPKVIITEKVIEVEKPLVTERIVEVKPEVDVLRVAKGLMIISEARSSHQYYLDHPEEQNKSTGNTSFQEYWIENYDFLESLMRSYYE